METTLIHNPRAGRAHSEKALVSALGAIGWRVRRSVHKADFDASCCRGSDVVVVAGGDGTVAHVARALADTGMAMAIIPMGTANNVARSLGLGVDAAAAIRALEDVVERRIDLGSVRGAAPIGGFFIEGVSVGAFAEVVAAAATKKKVKRLHDALDLMADQLDEYVPHRFEVEIDGHDYSDAFVLAAVMNMRSLGPAVNLAPEAKCDDGLLDVVLVRPEWRPSLVTHLRRAAEEGDLVLPSFETVTATHVHLRADGRCGHVDDRSGTLAGPLDVDVAAGALTLMAPSPSSSSRRPTPGTRGRGERAGALPHRAHRSA
ncbi:MAG: NAD(+)/NADH kinase [Labilithrix sp.]|nr:NAD(+)/NADH kinase [Labilithrix sp.]